MNIEDFFQPVKWELLPSQEYFEEASWYHVFSDPELEKGDLRDKKIALIGIISPGEESHDAYKVRKYLYSLKRAEYAEEIIDLGDFAFDYKPKTYQSFGFVLSELINMQIVPVIINGGQEITYAQYLAFSYLKRYINLISFDSHIDFSLREEQEMNGRNYLQRILMEEPSYLFHYTNIGYQSHFADTSVLNFMDRLFFDLHRLGDSRVDLNNLEPVIRQAHLISWDLGAIRQGDAPGSIQPGPNGFTGEEACLLCRYSGLSTNIRAFGIFSYSAANDRQEQTAHLAAQMIWYFADGYLNRYPENPMDNREEFMKFITSIQNNAYQIVFYKSKRTDRWWMEVPINEREFAGSNHIIPCSYKDYISATKEEIPERWWQAMKKLS